jgi:serine/threonine protein kinase
MSQQFQQWDEVLEYSDDLTPDQELEAGMVLQGIARQPPMDGDEVARDLGDIMTRRSCAEPACQLTRRGKTVFRGVCKRIYSIEDPVLNPNSTCLGAWKVMDLLSSSGSFGHIYNATNENGGRYILKIIPTSQSYKSGYFEREVTAQQRAASAGLAPKIIQAIVTGPKRYPVYGIVMEAMDITLKGVIDEILGRPSDYDNKVYHLRQAIRSAYRALVDLHALEISHCDAHLENIMYRMTPEVDLRRTGTDSRRLPDWRRAYIIDFGSSILDGTGDLEVSWQTSDDIAELHTNLIDYLKDETYHQLLIDLKAEARELTSGI